MKKRLRGPKRMSTPNPGQQICAYVMEAKPFRQSVLPCLAYPVSTVLTLSCEGEAETGPCQHEAETITTSLKRTRAIPCSWNQPCPAALKLQPQNYELRSCCYLSYPCITTVMPIVSAAHHADPGEHRNRTAVWSSQQG